MTLAAPFHRAAIGTLGTDVQIGMRVALFKFSDDAGDTDRFAGVKVRCKAVMGLCCRGQQDGAPSKVSCSFMTIPSE